jgi:hypothetical protein
MSTYYFEEQEKGSASFKAYAARKGLALSGRSHLTYLDTGKQSGSGSVVEI